MNERVFETLAKGVRVDKVVYFSNNKGGEFYMKATVSKLLEDGSYEGEIVKTTERTKPYHYVDFEIQVGEGVVRYSLPANIVIAEDGKPRSKLAQFLISAGMEIEKNKEYMIEELDQALVKTKVKVLVTKEKLDDGREVNNVKEMKAL